jgi:RimJ/RimL family protein N-acetyltransferase
MIEIDAGLCVLRAWRDEDAARIPELANDPEVARYMHEHFPHPYTLGDARAWIARVATFDPGLQFAIVVDGRPAGGIGFQRREGWARRSLQIGYWLGRAYWGRGIATAATRAICAYGFDRFGEVVRIDTQVFAPNVASARVLEKAGFVREGHLRRAVAKDDRDYDTYLYAQVRAS